MQGAPRCDIPSYTYTCYHYLGGHLKPMAKHTFIIPLKSTYKFIILLMLTKKKCIYNCFLRLSHYKYSKEHLKYVQFYHFSMYFLVNAS